MLHETNAQQHRYTTEANKTYLHTHIHTYILIYLRAYCEAVTTATAGTNHIGRRILMAGWCLDPNRPYSQLQQHTAEQGNTEGWSLLFDTMLYLTCIRRSCPGCFSALQVAMTSSPLAWLVELIRFRSGLASAFYRLLPSLLSCWFGADSPGLGIVSLTDCPQRNSTAKVS